MYAPLYSSLSTLICSLPGYGRVDFTRDLTDIEFMEDKLVLSRRMQAARPHFESPTIGTAVA